MSSRTKISVIIVSGIILAGLWLRLRHLGVFSFWTDEFFTVFAARNAHLFGVPHLPSGRPYPGALVFTCIVALFGRIFGFNEVAVRMPSVILGAALIPVTYWFVSQLFGRKAGIVTAFLVAACPFFVLWSQQCRMYTFFMLLYFILVFQAFRVIEQMAIRNRVGMASWGWLFLISFLSFQTHELTVFIIPSVAVYCLGMALFITFTQGWRHTIRCLYGRLAIALALMIGIGILLKFRDLSVYVRDNPAWRQNSPTYYRSLIHDTYPLYAYLYLAALLYCMIRRPRAGLYLACSFIIPFFGLSIFRWRGYQYLLFVFPFFLIPVGILFADAAGYMFNTASSSLRRYAPNLTPARIRVFGTAMGFITLIGIGYPLLFPWIKVSPERFVNFGRYHFSPYADLVKHMGKEDILICTEPFLIEYYSGRTPDHMILTRWHSDAMGEYDYSYRDKEGQAVDMNAGIPLIGLDGLKELEGQGRRIWIVSNTWFLNTNPSDAALLEYIKTTYTTHQMSSKIFAIYYKG